MVPRGILHYYYDSTYQYHMYGKSWYTIITIVQSVPYVWYIVVRRNEQAGGRCGGHAIETPASTFLQNRTRQPRSRRGGGGGGVFIEKLFSAARDQARRGRDFLFLICLRKARLRFWVRAPIKAKAADGRLKRVHDILNLEIE